MLLERGHFINFGKSASSPSSTEWHFVDMSCMSKTPQPDGSSHVSGLCVLWWRNCVLHLKINQWLSQFQWDKQTLFIELSSSLGKKRRTVLFALTAQPLGEEKEAVLNVKVVALGYTWNVLISLTMLQKRENKQTTSFETQFLMDCHDELLFTVICQSYSVVHLTSACHEPLHCLFFSVCIWKKRVSIM